MMVQIRNHLAMSVMAQDFSKTKHMPSQPRLTSLSHWPLGNPKGMGILYMCICLKELGDELYFPNLNVPIKVMWVGFVEIHFDHFETVLSSNICNITGFGLTPVHVLGESNRVPGPDSNQSVSLDSRFQSFVGKL